METLIANQVGSIRHAKLHGRDYIVAPLSMLVPGVLPGSKGPLFYPPDVVNRNPSRWNSIPIVVNHPMNANGPTSARDPDVINKQGIGFVFKARKDGKAEGWFDVDATKRIEPRIYKALITNTPIELSTGLYTKHKKATEGSHYKGKQFDGIITNLEPDHLAVLMDQTGACSLNDGCGVLINQEQGKKPMTLWQRLASLLVANSDDGQSPSMRKAYKRKPYHDALTEENFMEEDEADEFPIANESTDFELDEDEIVDLVANGWVTTKSGTHIFIGGNGQITKGPKGLKGKSIPGGGASKGKSSNEDPDDSSGLTKKIADSGKGKDKIDDLKPNMKPQASDYSAKSFGSLAAEYKKKTGKDPVGGMSRKDLIKRLVTNESKNSEGSQFGKPHITKGEPNMATKIKGKQKVTVNEDAELGDDEREELVESIVGNCNCHEDDSLVLHSLSDETLAKLAAMGITNNAMPPQFMKGKKKAVPAAQDDAEDAEDSGDDEEAEGEPPVAKKKQMVANTKKANTMSTEPKLSARQQMLINYAEEKMQVERDELIEKLVANAEDEDIEELTETYNSMSIPQLKLMAKALPKEEVKQVVQQPVINRMNAREIIQQRRNYAGATGAVLPSNQQRKAMTQNGKSQEPDFDDMPLETPTINHAELAGFDNGRFTHRD